MKAVALAYPDVDFVHVEVYTNLAAQNPEELEVVAAVTAWRLPTEPWVFVTDPAGIISDVFEGSLAPEDSRRPSTGCAGRPQVVSRTRPRPKPRAALNRKYSPRIPKRAAKTTWSRRWGERSRMRSHWMRVLDDVAARLG